MTPPDAFSWAERSVGYGRGFKMRGGYARKAALPAAASAVSTAEPHAEFILMAGRTACKEGPAYCHLPTPETQLKADRSAFERVV
jgi:hypothetical protein